MNENSGTFVMVTAAPTNMDYFTKSNINRLNTFLHLQTYGYGKDGQWGKWFKRTELEGITDSMLYFGTFGSSFPWHTEDADLPSINYLHEGKPKIWFVIPACELYLLFNY